MPYTAANYNVTNATPADIAKLNSSLAYISTDLSAASLLARVNLSGTNPTINIVHNGGDEYVPGTNTINWDPPDSALRVTNNGVNGVQSAALGLFHEFAHKSDPNISWEGKTAAENYATAQETTVARSLGEPTRANYDANFGTSVERNPTLHSRSNADGSCSWVEVETNSSTTVNNSCTPASLPSTTNLPVIGGTVNVNNASVEVAPNATATILGSGNNLVADPGSNVTVGGNGSTSDDAHINNVTETNATVHIADGSRVNVFATNGTVWGGSNDNFGVYGPGATIYGKDGSDGIWIGNNGRAGAADTLNALGAGTVTVVDHSNVVINGATNGANIYERGDSVDKIQNGSGAKEHIDGTGDLNYIYDSGDTVYDTGAGNRVDVYGSNVTTLTYGNGDVTNEFGMYDHAFNYGSNDMSWEANGTDSIFNGNPTDTTGSGSYGGYYGYYGYYGMGGKRDKVKAAVSSGKVGEIGAFDAQHGNPHRAQAAGHALHQLQNVIESDVQQAYTGARWDHETITWSLDGNGRGAGGGMNRNEEQAIKDAFDQWAKASGLQFKEVDAGAPSDINIGWGRFDSLASGVLGFTTYHAKDNHIQAGVTIQLEDPVEGKLGAGKRGDAIYAGTDATLSQVVLHEIGHALGLASNASASSIESYCLDSGNRTLSADDIVAIQALYGKAPPGVAPMDMPGVHLAIQAMAAFGSNSQGDFSPAMMVSDLREPGGLGRYLM